MSTSHQMADTTVSESGKVQVALENILAAGDLRELVRSGFPAQLHFRLELWRTGGWFDDLESTMEWDVVVAYDPAAQLYRVRRLSGSQNEDLGAFATLTSVESVLERPIRAPLIPTRMGRRYYYNLALDVEALSVSDLDQLERWLREPGRCRARRHLDHLHVDFDHRRAHHHLGLAVTIQIDDCSRRVSQPIQDPRRWRRTAPAAPAAASATQQQKWNSNSRPRNWHSRATDRIRRSPSERVLPDLTSTFSIVPMLKPGDVLVVDEGRENNTGSFGHNMSLQARNRGIVGLITNGCVRDIKLLRDEKFPAFCRGVCPRSAQKNTPGSINVSPTSPAPLNAPASVAVRSSSPQLRTVSRSAGSSATSWRARQDR